MQGTLGQHGFGPRGGGGRALATTPKGGGGIQRFTRRGKSPPSCPAGARSVSSGTYGTGAQTTAYRDCDMAAPRPAPVAPPPPPPPTAPPVSVQVSPAIQTQVSPQISPVFTQMQDSPGAGVVAAPQQVAPADMVSRPSQTTGFDPEAYREQIRREEQSRVESERVAAEWKRLEQEKARQTAAIVEEEARRRQTTREAAERYAAAESERTRFAEEQQAAEQQAREDAQSQQAAASGGVPSALPAYLPAVGPSAPMPVLGPSAPMPYTEPVDMTATAEARGEGTNLLPWIIAAAVGVGALMLTKGNKRGRKK